jgi:endo-1,4-beta-xylanase
MKHRTGIFGFRGLICAVVGILGLLFTGCPQLTDEETPFVAVTAITGVPLIGKAGINLTLSGTVTPDKATNQTIVWKVKSAGATKASITGNILSTINTGTVVVTATIADGKAAGTPYTQDFPITINPAIVAVTEITEVPLVGTMNERLTLSGTVTPDNASNKTIVWTVKDPGETGAYISTEPSYNDGISTDNYNLYSISPGTVVVTATIANGKAAGTPYTQDFSITINAGFVPVSRIKDIPSSGRAGTPLTLSGTVTPTNATNQTIVWTVSSVGGTGASITGNTLSTTNTGTVEVTATIAGGGWSAGYPYTQTVSIYIGSRFVPVTGITGVMSYASPGNSYYLSGYGTGSVSPDNATNKTIVWSVKDAGVTGASVSSSTLYVSSLGTVVVTATIADGLAEGTDYTQDFTIYVMVPVSDITNVPTTGTPGTALTLNGYITPSDATNKDIVWSVKDADGTGAVVTLDSLSTHWMAGDRKSVV